MGIHPVRQKELDMSFRCEGCKTIQPTGVAPIRTITKVRVLNEEFKDRREEIAEEKNFCAPCAGPWIEAAKEKERQKYTISLDAVEKG